MNNQDIKQSYDAMAKHFHLTRKKHLQAELLEFSKYFQDGQSVLDLGCGGGRMIRVLRNFELDCIFIDISEQQVNYAKKEDRGKIKKAEFIVEDVLNSNFQQNSFDVILCIATFHHIKTKKQRIKFLKNIRFWLKPNGYLLMTNWNLWQKKYLKYRNIFKGWKSFIVPYKNNQGKILANRFYHGFTIQELAKLLKQVSFENEKLELSESRNNIVSISRK